MGLKSHRKPSLLVLTSTFPRWKGDSEPPFVYELSSRLTSDFNVTVLSPRCMGSAIDETWENHLRVVRYPYFFPRMEQLAYQGGILAKLKSDRRFFLLVPFFLIGQLLAMIVLCRKQRFDVIHAHWIFPQAFLALLATRVLRQSIPVVVTSHGSDLYGLRGRLLGAIKRWVLLRAQKVTVVSRAMRNDATEMISGRTDYDVISMGVDLLNVFTPGSYEARQSSRILFVGRLVEQKGIDVLLKAMPKVLLACPDANVTIVGEGPDRSRLERLAEESGISARVTFVGKKQNCDIADFYRSASVFVMPSRGREGLGLVAVEAMGCGCPVIASDLPSVADFLIDGVTGLLFTPGDHAELADMLIHLLHDRLGARELAEAARKYVIERYDWAVISQRFSRALIAAQNRVL